MEKLEHLWSIYGNVNVLYGERYGIKVELTYDSAIALLGLYSKELKVGHLGSSVGLVSDSWFQLRSWSHGS